MNVVDFVIIGIVVVSALIGLRSGFLNQVSGTGGLIIDVLIAMHYNAEVAAMLVEYIEGDLPSRVAAFGGIVIATAVAARLAVWMVRKIFRSLVTGWFDRIAGVAGGAALGLILVGTGVYLLTGADLNPTRKALAASKLAPEVSRATVLSSTQPWCSQVDGGVAGTDCTDITGLIDKYFGESIALQVNSLLGDDFGSLADAVQTTLGGSPTDLTSILDGDAARAYSPVIPRLS
jgi:membrane protein required for colicin V production